MTGSLKDIPPLLHDARLSDCRWDGHLKTLGLGFRCLRRNVDGTPIGGGTVDLKLGGVERVVAHYSPASVTAKPSGFEPGSRITLADLEAWPHGAVEAHLATNSPQAEFDAATACVREALVGDPHVKGDEDAPARNEETVISYGLRRSRRGWVIATWSQGWPRFGSADKITGRQSWRDGWNLAE